VAKTPQPAQAPVPPDAKSQLAQAPLPPAAKSPLGDPSKTMVYSRPAQSKTEQLRVVVEKACGSAARKVTVQTRADGRIEVRLHVRNEADAPQLMRRVMSLPELAPHRPLVRVES
jgi:hypothetical protein